MRTLEAEKQGHSGGVIYKYKFVDLTFSTRPSTAVRTVSLPPPSTFLINYINQRRREKTKAKIGLKGRERCRREGGNQEEEAERGY